MHGIGQGMLDTGRELGRIGGRAIEAGGHHLGAWDITWFVLGLLLWAAAMTALVMGMIALVRHLKRPKDGGTTKEARPAKEEKTTK